MKHLKHKMLSLLLLTAMLLGTVSGFSQSVSAEEAFRVSFETFGGTKIEDQYVPVKSTAERPAKDPTRENYNFYGWYTDTTFRTEFDFENTVITQDTTIYAHFAEFVRVNAYNTETDSQGAGYVQVNDSDPKTNLASYFEEGQSVTIKAIPDDGYRFVRWAIDSPNGDTLTTDAQYSFTFNGMVYYYAIFEKETSRDYRVTIMDAEHGTGSADPTYGPTGTKVSLSFDSDFGYWIKEWLVIEGNVEITGDSFMIGSENVIIQPVFERVPQLDVYVYDQTTDTKEVGGKFLYYTNSQYANEGTFKRFGMAIGDTETVKAVPDEGYKFVGWMENDPKTGTLLTTNASYSFKVEAVDRVLYAVFKTTRSGWYSINDNKYYFLPDGTPAKGVKEIDGIIYYFDENGVMQTGWQQVSGHYYYFDPDNGRLTGWQNIDGSWYYLGDDGIVSIGWRKIDGNYYYFDNTGKIVIGWKKIDGKYYYFKSKGAMATDWNYIDSYWYYFDPVQGDLKLGWQYINGNYYYLGTNGKMTVGWKNINGSWYYFKKNGILHLGWLKYENAYYYLNPANGKMVTGFMKIDGEYYLFNKNGTLFSGWLKNEGYWYYFDYEMAISEFKKIDKEWYYFDSKGRMATGWKKVSGYWYYFGNNGKMRFGWQKINGYYYYFDSNGRMVTGRLQISKKWYTFDKSGALTGIE